MLDERVGRQIYFADDKSPREIQRIEKAIQNSKKRNQIKSFDGNGPSRGAHVKNIPVRNNKSFWSSGLETGIKSVPVMQGTPSSKLSKFN